MLFRPTNSAPATGRRANPFCRSDHQTCTMEKLYDLFPDYARDLKLNLQNVLKQAELTEQQTWGTAVASAIAAREPRLLRAIQTEAALHLSPEAMNGAKAAAAVMGMNNI